MDYLTLDEVLLIHSMVLDETGGLHGIRDREALLSILAAPQQAVFGKELYPSPFLRTAVYAQEIIMRHPFLDGNKRTGMAAAIVFLQRNDIAFGTKRTAIERIALQVVTKKLSIAGIADWLKRNSARQ